MKKENERLVRENNRLKKLADETSWLREEYSDLIDEVKGYRDKYADGINTLNKYEREMKREFRRLMRKAVC